MNYIGKITEDELNILLDVANDKSHIDSLYVKLTLYYFTSEKCLIDVYDEYFFNHEEINFLEYKYIVDLIDEKYLSKLIKFVNKSPIDENY
jgi:hypothetical protein